MISRVSQRFPQVRVVYPDGHVEWHHWRRLRGLSREDGSGVYMRPLVMTCEIDMQLVDSMAERETIRMSFQKCGVFVSP